MLRLPFRLLTNLWRLIAAAWGLLVAALISRSRRKQPTFVSLDLEPSYRVAAAPAKGLQRLFQEPKLTLLELREAMAYLKEDRDIAGALIRLKGASMGFARTQDLIAMLDDLRASGKRVIIHADSLTQRELLIMSAAGDRVLTPAGRVYLFGLRFEELFALDLLERLGIRGQFVHIGDFKTATHRFHKNRMTAPQRLMMSSLQRGLIRQFEARYTLRLGLEQEQVERALDLAPLDVDEARALDLITDHAFGEHLEEWLKATLRRELFEEAPPATIAALQRHSAPRALSAPLDQLYDGSPLEPTNKEDKKLERERQKKAPRAPRVFSLDHYLATRRTPYRWKPLLKRPSYLALLDLSGAIVLGGEGPTPVGSGASVKADEVIPKLLALKRDRRCKGVLLHVNSPGGSALASDLMWHEIQALRAEKPVVCYCSDVAASGGYYLACAADEIICQPGTITGSIGVITGKVALGGALERIDVHVDVIEQHPNSRFLSPFAPLPQPVMDNLVRDARGFYARFLDRVGQARSIPRRRLHRYARGRVYLGDEALDRGLVDGLGGFEQAIATLHELSHSTPQSAPLKFISHREQNLRDLARGSLLSMAREAPAAQTLAALCGDALEPARLAAWFHHEPTLALMPWRLT